MKLELRHWFYSYYWLTHFMSFSVFPSAPTPSWTVTSRSQIWLWIGQWRFNRLTHWWGWRIPTPFYWFNTHRHRLGTSWTVQAEPQAFRSCSRYNKAMRWCDCGFSSCLLWEYLKVNFNSFLPMLLDLQGVIIIKCTSNNYFHFLHIISLEFYV